MRFGGLWRAGGPQPDPAAQQRIKQWTREVLGLGEDVTVSANEIVCADPACPGTETVILVMRPGERTRAYKLAGAMAEVSREDMAAALGAA